MIKLKETEVTIFSSHRNEHFFAKAVSVQIVNRQLRRVYIFVTPEKQENDRTTLFFIYLILLLTEEGDSQFLRRLDVFESTNRPRTLLPSITKVCSLRISSATRFSITPYRSTIVSLVDVPHLPASLRSLSRSTCPQFAIVECAD